METVPMLTPLIQADSATRGRDERQRVALRRR